MTHRAAPSFVVGILASLCACTSLEPINSAKTEASGVCNLEAQRALEVGDLERARQGFLQAAMAARKAGGSEDATCSFFLGLVAQKEAQREADPGRRQGRLAEAARWYEAALSANTHAPGLVANLARVYSDLGRRERANQLYEASLPKMEGEAHLVLSRSYAQFLEKEDWRKSVDLYREVLRAEPADDQSWDALFFLLERNAPSQLAGAIWEAVEAGEVLSAQQQAIKGLNLANLTETTKVELLSALVGALSRLHYPSADFAGSEIGESLNRLKADSAIGPAVQEIILAHEKTTPEAKDFSWWAAQKSGGGHAPLAVFRALLQSLALRVRSDDLLVARAFLETAEKLSPNAVDPLLFEALLVNYAATGDRQKIASSEQRWEPLLQKASPHLDQSALKKYRLTAEAIRQWEEEDLREANEPPKGGADGGGRLAYDSNSARCVHGGSGCSSHVQLEIPDLFPPSKGLRDDIVRTALIEIGCNGRHLLGFRTSPPSLQPAGEVRLARFALSLGVPSSSWPPSSSNTQLPPLAEDRCIRVPLNAQPAWLSSAAWAGPTQWVLADPLRGQLLGFAEDGDLLDVAPPTLPPGEPAYVRVHASPTGEPVAEDPSGKLFWQDEGPTGRREAELVGRTGPDGMLRSVFQWSLLGEDEALAVANLLGPQGTWTTAIVRLPLSSNRYEVLHRIDTSRPEAILYRAGIPALAGVGGVGYFLALEESPAGLYRVPPGGAPQRLIAWPGIAPELRVELARDQGMARTPDLFRLLERASLPGGLYGAGDALFLLRRAGGGVGAMRSWELLRLDPRTGRTLHALDIPTTARHLTVAPGSHHWAFFEKGEVTAIGHQSTPTVLLVPTSWIAGKGATTETRCDG